MSKLVWDGNKTNMFDSMSDEEFQATNTVQWDRIFNKIFEDMAKEALTNLLLPPQPKQTPKPGTGVTVKRPWPFSPATGS